MARDWDNYLAKTTSRRDFSNTYTSRRTFGERVRGFFVGASQLIERPFHWRVGSRKNYGSSHTSQSYSRPVDLSHISSEETFVIPGKPQSRVGRFWKRLKAVFRDDKPQVPYNSRHQFPIRGQRQSASEMARQRKREMADSIDLSAIAATMEKGRIK